MSLVLYSLVAFGLWYVLGASSLLAPLRDWANEKRAAKLVIEMIECPACAGFWIGLAASNWGLGIALHPLPLWASASLGTCATNLLLSRFAGLFPPR